MFEQSYLFCFGFFVGHCGPLYNRNNDSLRTDSGNESSKHWGFGFFLLEGIYVLLIKHCAECFCPSAHKNGRRNIS